MQTISLIYLFILDTSSVSRCIVCPALRLILREQAPCVRTTIVVPLVPSASHDALLCALGLVLIWILWPVGWSLMSSGWGLRVDAERHHKSLEKNMSLGRQIYGVGCYLWGRLSASESLTRGASTPSSCYWCASSISNLFHSIRWHLLPWLYTSPVSACFSFCKWL